MNSSYSENSFIICLGSNHSEGNDIIKRCLLMIGEYISIKRISDIYPSSSLNLKGERENYYNCVFEGFTNLELSFLEKKFKIIELLLGRDDEARKKGIVPIDIDIIILNMAIIRDKDYRSQYFQKGYKQILKKATTR